MARGEVDVVLVGADRVAANGDTANKVGTYTLAVLAARHGDPVLRLRADQLGRPRDAPTARPSRSRSARADEVTRVPRRAHRPARARRSANPAFDVTPAELITGIVTEEGVVARAVRGRPARRGRERGGALGGDARLPRGPSPATDARRPIAAAELTRRRPSTVAD